MTDAEKLESVVRLAIGLADDAALDGTAYGQTDGWDSVGHMELIVGIEQAFGVSIEARDMLEMSDYDAVRRILRERYAVMLGD